MKLSEAWRLRILYFLAFCCTASWLPVMADFCKSRGLSGTQTSLILSITPVMMFLVQPLYGSFADKFGFKKCLIFSSFFASISFLGYLHDGGYTWLILVTLFMSLFYNTIQPVLDSLALRLEQANPKFSYGSLRIAGAAGWSFTGILTGQVIDGININAIFIISSVSMALVFAFTFLLNPDAREKNSAAGSAFKNVGTVIKTPSLIFLLVCVFLISAGATTIWNFYSMYMKENGASASLVGYGLSFQGLCELPLFYFSAKIILRLGLKTTLVITVFATVLRLLLYSVIKNPVAALPVEMLHGFSWSLFWVVCVEYVNKLVDKNWLATGQSLLYAAYFGAGAIAGNYWTGFLYDNKMKLADIFLLNAVILLLVAILILVFLKKDQKELKTA
jgi:MFS transporter, PPP family, 3-phenylpropionic acid transporter